MKKALFPFAGAAVIAAAASAAEADWRADFRRADLNDSGGLSQVELAKSKAPSE